MRSNMSQSVSPSQSYYLEMSHFVSGCWSELLFSEKHSPHLTWSRTEVYLKDNFKVHHCQKLLYYPLLTLLWELACSDTTHMVVHMYITNVHTQCTVCTWSHILQTCAHTTCTLAQTHPHTLTEDTHIIHNNKSLLIKKAFDVCCVEIVPKLSRQTQEVAYQLPFLVD